MAATRPRSPKEGMEELRAEPGKEEGTRGGSLWVEIRIPTDSDLERRNLEPVYRWIRNEAYGAGDVFEFAVAGMESSEGEGLRTRYFMRAPDYDRKRDLWDSLEARGVNVSAVDESLDFSSYEREARFEMEDDFAIPLIPAESIERGNFPRTPEQLASAVKSGGALRVAIRRDDDARNEIQGFINREEGKGGDPWQVLTGMLDNLFAGRTYDGVPETRRERPRREEETEYSRLAKDRRDRIHAHCEVRAYGSERQIRRISRSFGFELNDIVELDCGEPESNRERVKERVDEKLTSGFERVEAARERLSSGVKTAEAVSESKEGLQENLEAPETLNTVGGREKLASTLSEMSEALDNASEDVSGTSEKLKDASEDVSDALEALEDYQEDRLVPNRASGAGAGMLKASLLLPLLLPVALAYFGIWDPLSVLGSSSSLGMIRSLWPLLVPLGITVGSWLWLFGGEGKPIVLTLGELSVIGSLPFQPETLPVELETPSPPSYGEKPAEEKPAEEKRGEEKDESESDDGGESKNERERK